MMGPYENSFLQNAQELPSFLSNEMVDVQSETPIVTKASISFKQRRFFCFPPRVCILPVPPRPQLTTDKPITCPPSPICPASNDYMKDIALEIGHFTFILLRDKEVCYLLIYYFNLYVYLT